MASTILSRASPVFRSMLGPHFREGHELAASGSVELALDDACAAHMAIICRVLHMRIDGVPLRFESKAILEIAALADKYDCCKALAAMAYTWISEGLHAAGEAVSCQTRCDFFAASYLFKHKILFSRLAHDLVLYTKPSDEASHEHYPKTVAKVLCE